MHGKVPYKRKVDKPQRQSEHNKPPRRCPIGYALRIEAVWSRPRLDLRKPGAIAQRTNSFMTLTILGLNIGQNICCDNLFLTRGQR